MTNPTATPAFNFNGLVPFVNGKAAVAPAPPVPDFADAIHENRELEDQLVNYGYTRAGMHLGNPQGLSACLDTLNETYRRSNSKKWEAGEKDRLLVNGQVKELAVQNDELEQKLGRMLECTQHKIASCRERMSGIWQKIAAVQAEKLSLPVVSKLLLVFAWLVFIPLTVGLFIFYVNASYRAFYPVASFSGGVDELKQMLESSGIFDTTALLKGITAIYPIFFPFILFTLGVVLHMLLEGIIPSRTNRQKMVLIAALLAATMGLDMLVAYKVHENINLFKELSGMHVDKWYASADFWLVLGCGFGAFLVWSFVLHGIQLMQQLQNPLYVKEKHLKELNKELLQSEKDLSALEDSLEEARKKLEEEMSANRLKMVQLQGTLLEDKVVVTYEGRLKLCLDAFYTGWIKYVCHKGDSIDACEQTFRLFISTHFTPVN